VNRRGFLAGLSAGLAAQPAIARAQATPSLQVAARNAWLFVLPLVIVADVRARPNPLTGKRLTMNVLRHARSLSGPANRAVTAPNNDTLYSSAFVDMTAGPVGLVVPPSGSRYLSVQIMDMYTNDNFILSPRTGGAAGTWRLIAPGTRPRGNRDLQLSTPHGWLLVRILVDGPEDLPAVHALQDRFELQTRATPLPLAYADESSDWPAYFASAAQLLSMDPPARANELDAFDAIRNACRSHDFARSGYSPQDAAAIDAGVAEANVIAHSGREAARFVDGWTYPRADLGEFDDHFAFRAIIAVSGLAALTPPEAMYLRSAGDGRGLFGGDGPYRLRLSQPIPVDAFWSLTMYEARDDGRFFLTENPLNRYSIGDRTRGLVRDADGSLDLWIGRSDPGGARTANWLPAPKQGPYALTLRAYLPKHELLSGAYRVPPVEPA